MIENSYEPRAYESVDEGTHLGLQLKNEQKTKFRQLRAPYTARETNKQHICFLSMRSNSCGNFHTKIRR